MSGVQTGLQKVNKPKKKKKSRFLLKFSAVILVVMLVCGLISFRYVSQAEDEREVASIDVNDDDAVEIEIPRGSSTDDIVDILSKNGIIKYPFIFKMMSKINGFDGMYKSGTHIVNNELDYDMIMRILSSNPKSVKVMIPEGYHYIKTVDTLSKQKLVTKVKFDAAAKSSAIDKLELKFLKDVPKRENRLEGYLFPDTYEFDMKAGEDEIIKAFLENFDKKFKPEYYQRAEELGLTVDQVITLASIVEREAQLEEERKIIAGIFYNRLKNKNKSLKKLQSCATIQYIYLNREGKVKERILDADTKIDDPYNTYMYEGLPPGPICSPGISSIEAALNPILDTGYLYFVSKGDGSHEFSKTLQQHQAAVRKYGLK